MSNEEDRRTKWDYTIDDNHRVDSTLNIIALI